MAASDDGLTLDELKEGIETEPLFRETLVDGGYVMIV